MPAPTRTASKPAIGLAMKSGIRRRSSIGNGPEVMVKLEPRRSSALEVFALADAVDFVVQTAWSVGLSSFKRSLDFLPKLARLSPEVFRRLDYLFTVC